MKYCILGEERKMGIIEEKAKWEKVRTDETWDVEGEVKLAIKKPKNEKGRG